MNNKINIITSKPDSITIVSVNHHYSFIHELGIRWYSGTEYHLLVKYT